MSCCVCHIWNVSADMQNHLTFASPLISPAVFSTICSIKDNEMPANGTPPSLTKGPVEKDHDSVLTSGSGEDDSNASLREEEDAHVTGGQETHPAQGALDVDIRRRKIRNVGNKGNSINFVANDFRLQSSARVEVTCDVENVGNGSNSVNYVGNTDGPEGLEAFLKLVALVKGNPG